jgi:hypothetical protein
MPPISTLSAGLSSTADNVYEATHLPPGYRITTASWVFEILAVIFSVFSIVAIIGVLYHEDGQPLTAWTFVLVLNTVIATLGTKARATLAFAISVFIGQQKWVWLYGKADRLVAFKRFDEASREPWGGDHLLVWLRARYKHLNT